MVRGRRAEVYLVRAGELERRCFALPLARLFTELARERVELASHEPCHVGDEIRRQSFTRVVRNDILNCRRQRRRHHRHLERTVHLVVVRGRRLELHEIVADIRERRHFAPVARAVRTVEVRDGLLVADSGERRHQSARVERLARIVGDDILNGRGEHRVGDRVRRARVGQLVLVSPLHIIVVHVSLRLSAVFEHQRPLCNRIISRRRSRTDVAGDGANKCILVLPPPAFHLSGIFEQVVKRKRFVAVAHHLRIRRHDVEKRARLDGSYADHLDCLRIRPGDNDEVCDEMILRLNNVCSEYTRRLLDDVRNYAVGDLFDDVRRKRNAHIVVGGLIRPEREGRRRRRNVQTEIGAETEADGLHRLRRLGIRSLHIVLHARVQRDKLHFLRVELADSRLEVDRGHIAVRP